jgi:hypothetical protein
MRRVDTGDPYEVVQGGELEATIRRLYADPAVSYLHVHNARPGCYNCRVIRAAAPAAATTGS